MEVEFLGGCNQLTHVAASGKAEGLSPCKHGPKERKRYMYSGSGVPGGCNQVTQVAASGNTEGLSPPTGTSEERPGDLFPQKSVIETPLVHGSTMPLTGSP